MTFKKTERLKSEKLITRLFRNGKSFACYPLRLVYTEIDPLSKKGISTSFDAQNVPSPLVYSPILFSLSVPKKTFKRAVDRNLLRRRLRESYRLHKNELYNYLNNNTLYSKKQFAFMVLYVAKEELPFDDIEKGVLKMFRKFKEHLDHVASH